HTAPRRAVAERSATSFVPLLATAIAAFLSTPFARAEPNANDERDVIPVNSDRVQLDFQVSPDSGPVTAVQLWLTTDDGRTWREAAVESGAASPVVFHTEKEG